MDPTANKSKRKTIFVSTILFILILLGYLIFNYITLKSNQAKDSRAEKNELAVQTVRRVNPSEALYSNTPLNTYTYTLHPTYYGGIKELVLSFDSEDRKQELLSVLESSKTPSEEVYSIVQRSKDSQVEKYIAQFAAIELIDMIKADGKITIRNFPTVYFSNSEIILFKIH